MSVQNAFPANVDDLPSYIVERAKIRLRHEKGLVLRSYRIYSWFAKPLLRLWIDHVMFNHAIYSEETPTATALARAVLSPFLSDGAPFNAPSKNAKSIEK